MARRGEDNRRDNHADYIYTPGRPNTLWEDRHGARGDPLGQGEMVGVWVSLNVYLVEHFGVYLLDD